MNDQLRFRDVLLKWSAKGLGLTTSLVVLVIAAFVAKEAIPAFQEIGLPRFFTDDVWSPLDGQFNIIPIAMGTLLVAFGASVVSAPVGIGTALFLNFYCPVPLRNVTRRLIEILAGIPSVVFGLWGLAVLVPWLLEISPTGQGKCLIAGIAVLSLMTLPTIVISTDAAIRTIPTGQIQAGAALGLGKESIIWQIVFPLARKGIATGLILQIGRALGETMAVLMICGNVPRLPGSVFDPIRTMTANIALEMSYADPTHRSVLFLTGLILLFVIVVVMIVANFVAGPRESRQAS